MSYRLISRLLRPFAVISIGLILAVLVTPMSAHASGESVPETVVLLHGLGRSKLAMRRLEQRLEEAGFRVESIDYQSLTRTPAQIIESVEAQIKACCESSRGTLHFVGHSLGGLLIRAYLQRHEVPHLGRVVMIGTPNQGTEIVDRFRDRWWMRLAGPTGLALGTGADSLPSTLKLPNYPVGVIAGVSGSGTNDAYLAGDDDGLVTVEATKLPGMADFIVVDSSHSFMRTSEDVLEQTVFFLRNGRFDRESRPNSGRRSRPAAAPPLITPSTEHGSTAR